MEILFKQFAFLNLQIFLATEPLPDIYKYNIATVELFLLGNHLKMVRSKNISTKQFQITGFDVIIPPDQVFETFVEVANVLTITQYVIYLHVNLQNKYFIDCFVFYLVKMYFRTLTFRFILE